MCVTISRVITIVTALILINYWQTESFAFTTKEIATDMSRIETENFTNNPWQEPHGFLWYSEQPMSKSPAYCRSKLSSEIGKKQQPHDQRIESLKQKFNNAQRKALDNPTLENVIKAQKLQKIIMEKSQKFAAMWQLATLIEPSLLNNNEPSNSLHKKLYQETTEQINNNKLINLAKDWGLILQVSNNCPYCQAFAPIAKQFASKYGFQLLLVSNNGTDFQNIKTSKDTGLLQALNPENIVPILYLVDSSGKRIYPVAREIISEDKIIENIMTIDLHYQNLAKSENNDKKYHFNYK
ncbi:conjugal transfer protein TraF [Candidatus Tisiphia endosymbiont of Metellina segmentata]|uniref:conjugal transfer protein TraF n=1 Tax=Candidatus Tisiphia endosymbiont of Metellina segmentata TaxID=3066274 RepID=UPI00313C9ACA